MKTMTILATLLLCAAAFADNITQTHEAGVPYVDAGATAVDIYDGDITSRIVATGSVNWGMLTVSAITYNVTDLSGNAADPAVRTVTVKDTWPPVITLKGPAEIKVARGYALEVPGLGATALDSFSGACTVTATWDKPLILTKAGIYTVTYTAKDSSGNVATPLKQVVKVVGKCLITIRP